MDIDSLHERGKALEDRFFSQRDEELLARLRDEIGDEKSRANLAATSGIHDDEALNTLIENGIGSETIIAVGLIPLVFVAWADNRMEESERDAILKASNESGITEASAAYLLIESWIQEHPGADLLDCWKKYILALKEDVDSSVINQMKNSIMERARRVADAAGGFLGMGNRTSAVEKKVLDDLESVF